MAVKELTRRLVETVRPPAVGRIEIRDTRAPGLALRITDRDVRTWSVAFRIAGRQRRYTIGNARSIGLADARDMANKVITQVKAGIDPAEALKDAAANTVGAVAERWLQHVAASGRASTAREWARIVNVDILPAWERRPIASIAKGDVNRLLDQIEARRTRGKSPLVHSNRVLSRAKTLFNWAVERDYLAASPADKMKPRHEEVERERVLADAEIVAVWNGCDQLGPPYGPMFRLLLLTAQRRLEVGAMRRSEIDLDGHLWVIPGARTKNKRAHAVQLADQAVAIIAGLPRVDGDDLVFSIGGKQPSGFSAAKAALDELVPDVKAWTLHDLRRTAATHMAENGVAPHVVDKILNHVSGKIRGVARIYNRHEYSAERKVALQAWADHIDRLVAGRPLDNVIPLKGRIT